MSDERQSDDWWMASDGRWYPPTSTPEPPSPPKPPKDNAEPPKSKPGCVVALVLALLFVGGCTAYVMAVGGDDEKGDASAQLACDQFRSTARDQSAGLLTYSELRDQIKKVNDRAWVSETSGIADAAQAMLAAATAVDDVALASAVNRMGDACDAIDR